jgi:hypothetical protein
MIHPLWLWPAALAGLWPAPGPELTEIPWMLMDVVHQWFVIQKLNVSRLMDNICECGCVAV